MMLAHIASKIKNRSFVLGHVSHNIRNKNETEKDYTIVKEYAKTLDFDFAHESIEVSRTGNIEDNARKMRYSSLYWMAVNKQCSHIATAHHADDHLVTILMHICRGCGSGGLVGIRRESNINDLSLIRPLLDATKEDIEDEAKKREIPYNYDYTNSDTSFVRNDFNRNILPILKKHYPRASENSVKMSERLNDKFSYC